MTYNFCFVCGQKLTKKKSNLFVCKNDHHHYLNPKPCQAVILLNPKREILLIKRECPPKKGFWDLPGGFVDADETLEESTYREIKEELGIKLKNLRYFSSCIDRYFYKGINHHTICFVFISYISKIKFKNSEEFSEIKFFPPSQIPFKKIAFSGLQKVLSQYLKLGSPK